MTEIEIESADRYQLVKYLLEHVYTSAGPIYHDMARSELQRQDLTVLRNMAAVTCRAELEKKKRRADLRAARRQDEHKDTVSRRG